MATDKYRSLALECDKLSADGLAAVLDSSVLLAEADTGRIIQGKVATAPKMWSPSAYAVLSSLMESYRSSPLDVRANMIEAADTVAGLSVGLTNYWTLNALSGARGDIVGSAHLTESGAPTYMTGKRDYAVSPYAATYIQNTSLPKWNLSKCSWAFWYWKSGNPAGLMSAVLSYQASNPSFGFRMGSGGQLNVFVRDSGMNVIPLVNVGASNMNNGAWHLVILTWESQTFSVWDMYQKSDVIASAGGSLPLLTDDGGGLKIGDPTYGNFGVDEMGFWTDRALDAAARSALWNNGAGRFYDLASRKFIA